MDSFQAKIGWKRLRNRENSKKIATKFKKLKKLWPHFKPKQVGKGREREKIKTVVPFRSHPTQNRKFQKNN